MNLQNMTGAELLQAYRDVMLKLGGDRGNQSLSRQADQLEEELNRRLAW